MTRGKTIGNFGMSKTQQHFKGRANINTIIAKYRETGTVPVNSMNPVFGDVSSGAEYQDILNRQCRIKEEFESLPAKVKKKFRQNPAKLIDFLKESKNREEAIELGLIEKPEPDKIGTIVKKVVDQVLEKKTEEPKGDKPSNT